GSVATRSTEVPCASSTVGSPVSRVTTMRSVGASGYGAKLTGVCLRGTVTRLRSPVSRAVSVYGSSSPTAASASTSHPPDRRTAVQPEGSLTGIRRTGAPPRNGVSATSAVGPPKPADSSGTQETTPCRVGSEPAGNTATSDPSESDRVTTRVVLARGTGL